MLILTVYGEPREYAKVIKSQNSDRTYRLDGFTESGGTDTYDGISDLSGYVLTNEDGTPAEYETPELSPAELLQSENKLLKAQLQALTERSEFLDDCIAEMATQVYSK